MRHVPSKSFQYGNMIYYYGTMKLLNLRFHNDCNHSLTMMQLYTLIFQLANFSVVDPGFLEGGVAPMVAPSSDAAAFWTLWIPKRMNRCKGPKYTLVNEYPGHTLAIIPWIYFGGGILRPVHRENHVVASRPLFL